MPHSRKRSPWNKGCLTALAAIPVLLVITAITLTLWQRTQTNALKKRFHAQGLPTSLQDLDNWYEHVPDDENAALGFIAAIDLLYFPRISDKVDLPLPGIDKTWLGEPQSLEGDALRYAEQFLTLNRASLNQAQLASILERSRYPMDLTLGPFRVKTDHLRMLRELALTVLTGARVQAQSGNIDTAVESLRAAFACGRSLQNEPLVISQVVRTDIEEHSARAASAIVSGHVLTQQQLNDLATDVDKSLHDDANHRFRKGLVPEIVQVAFERWYSDGDHDWWLRLNERNYARYMSQVWDATELQPREAVQRLASIEDSRETAFLRDLYLVADASFPPVRRMYMALNNGIVNLELMKIVLALESFRLKNGGLPDSLSELEPIGTHWNLIDPYSLEPYKYVVEGQGYVVYSIGPDGEDNDGAPLEKQKGDIPLRVTR